MTTVQKILSEYADHISILVNDDLALEMLWEFRGKIQALNLSWQKIELLTAEHQKLITGRVNSLRDVCDTLIHAEEKKAEFRGLTEAKS